MRSSVVRVQARWVSILGFIVAITSAHAIEVTEWKNRQTLTVERPGIIKLALPPATLDLARPDLGDIRLVDAAGREVPYLAEHPAAVVPGSVQASLAFRATLNDSSTQLVIDTGSRGALDAIELSTPAGGFIKAARVEVGSDGETWETVATGVPIFRQSGAEQLRVSLEGRTARRVRITLDDSHTQPVPFTGARVWLTASRPAPTLPLPARLVRREEFVGESVLTLDLGGAHVPLAAIEFATNEPLFARQVSIGVKEVRADAPVERALVKGSIYRVAAEGLPPSARLEVPLQFDAPARELLVHIVNGDSPPLAIDEVRLRQRPLWLVFRATQPGTYTLLTGQNQIAPPNYDLSALSSALRGSGCRSRPERTGSKSRVSTRRDAGRHAVTRRAAGFGGMEVQEKRDRPHERSAGARAATRSSRGLPQRPR